MNFSSLIFLFYFLPLFLLTYNLISPERRNLIIVLGSSFFICWGSLLSALLYKQSASYPAQTSHPIDKKNLDLKGEILTKDVVVIECNEQTLSQLGFGFIEDALKALGEN